MAVLVNYTNEFIKGMHAGQDYKFEGWDPESGKNPQKFRVSDRASNHLLMTQALYRRGLAQINEGDDEEQVKKDALDRNYKFKVQQLQVFNERNERRKSSGSAYVSANKWIKQYAEDTGIELFQPYSVEDKKKEDLRDLQTENAELKAGLAETRLEMRQMMDEMKKSMVPKVDKRSKSYRDSKIRQEAKEQKENEVVSVHQFRKSKVDGEQLQDTPYEQPTQEEPLEETTEVVE